MKNFEEVDLFELRVNGYEFVGCITHENKFGAVIAYLYPFKAKSCADHFIIECQDHDPLLFEVNESLMTLINGKNYLEVYLSSFRDLHRRATYFDNSEMNFMLLDRNLNIIDVNESLLANHQLHRRQLIGQNFTEVSSNSTLLKDKFMEVIHSGRPLIMEELKGDNRYGNNYYRLKAFKVGDGLGLTSSNITDLRNMIQVLETFAYKSSHDMRSPVTSVLGLINLIVAEDEKNPEVLRHYLDLILKQMERLDNFTNILLQSLKLGKQERRHEEINFAVLVEEVKQTLLFIDGFKVVTFHQSIPDIPQFYFDRTTLVFLMQNLIDNAIKYRNRNRNDAFVKIEIIPGEEYIEIIVADNGIGIAQEKQRDVFKMFYRATEEVPGTGLGLYTLKQSIEKIGGQISFKSIENLGTTFNVILPNQKIE